jgi:hypothetical protein
LLPAAGLVPPGTLTDRWASSNRQRESVLLLHV